MHVEVCLLLLFCSFVLCVSSSATIKLVRNATNLSNENYEYTLDCSDNTSSSLSFVTSLSIRGCPIFVHRLGTVKTGRFVLEPTFCITEQSSLRSPGAHFDLLTNEFYFSFPVNVTDESLVTEVASMLSHLSPKSVSFLEVTSVRLNSSRSLAFTSASFLWGPTESVGHLRLVCSGFVCQSLNLYLPKGQIEVFQNIILAASMRASEGCASVERAFPVTVSRAPFLPIKSLQRSRSSPLRACSDLQLFKVVHLDNCTVYVHQRRGKRGHFVIEPLLCPTPNFQLLRDFSIGSHYVRLPMLIEDASVITAVRPRIGSASVESIEFMKLWDADIHLSPGLSQWTFESLRLSVDRRTAELRAYCTSQISCDALGFVLRSEPVNFWRNVQWTAVSVLNDDCKFSTPQRRFTFRMMDRPFGRPTAVRRRTDSRWSAQDLRDRTVRRDERTFMIIGQRGCDRASNFQRTWREYVAGFGDDSNFWIGLDIIHSLTSRQGTVMRVEMLLWNETEWFAEYSGFTVGNATTKYLMRHSRMVAEKSSLVYDALASGFPFSAMDKDNYGYSSTYYCSRSWGGNGGWWYSSCGFANPHGNYHFAQSTSTGYSSWMFKEGVRSLKEFRMMVQM